MMSYCQPEKVPEYLYSVERYDLLLSYLRFVVAIRDDIGMTIDHPSVPLALPQAMS